MDWTTRAAPAEGPTHREWNSSWPELGGCEDGVITDGQKVNYAPPVTTDPQLMIRRHYHDGHGREISVLAQSRVGEVSDGTTAVDRPRLSVTFLHRD